MYLQLLYELLYHAVDVYQRIYQLMYTSWLFYLFYFNRLLVKAYIYDQPQYKKYENTNERN